MNAPVQRSRLRACSDGYLGFTVYTLGGATTAGAAGEQMHHCRCELNAGHEGMGLLGIWYRSCRRKMADVVELEGLGC